MWGPQQVCAHSRARRLLGSGHRCREICGGPRAQDTREGTRVEQQIRGIPSFQARGELSLELVHATEGASQVARGSANAVSIVAAVEPGGFAQLPQVSYVEKMVAGPGARGAIDLDDSITDNLRRIAFARDARVKDLTVGILDRPRHQEIIAEVDAAIGIDGLHATLIAACAVRCLGGELQARLWPRNEEERTLIGDLAGRAYGVSDLVPAADVAVAITGVTGGQLLPGVVFGSGYAESFSLLMSSRQATVRRLTATHHTVGESS